MANISSWLPDVSARVPGASKLEIESALRSVVRDFCSKSLLYLRQLTPVNIVAGTVTYSLTAPTDTAIVGVERVEVNGQEVDANSMDLLDRSNDSWRAETSNQPTEFMVDAEKVLRFRQIPTENYANGLVVWASLKPSISTAIVPDFIYNDWYDTILYGVMSNLMKIPNKSYTNIQGGEYYEQMYRADLGDAKKKKVVGLAKVSIIVQPPPFSVVG